MLLLLLACADRKVEFLDETGAEPCAPGTHLEGVDCVPDPEDMDGDGHTADVDCDDADPAVHPDAVEVCDARDNDCDGAVDDLDADGDGFTTCVGDCDDAAPSVHPGATEVCGDGLDNDCSGDASGCGWSGTHTTAEAALTLTGEEVNTWLGSGLSLSGDVNGDGRDDLLVGARQTGSSYTSPPGVVYVFHGPIGAETLANPDQAIIGDVTAASFGSVVEVVGDTDLDGKDDFLVGASRRPEGTATYVGAAWFFRGDPSDTSVAGADATVTCSDALAQCGIDVAGAGDIDGDGVPDALVSAAGRVGVFSGASFSGTRPLTDADVVVTADASASGIGWAIDGLGDIDGDGLGDWVATAHAGADGYGAAYVFLGGGPAELGATDADAVIVGENASGHFGSDVAGLGDTNGDGLGDFVVGAYDNRDGGMQAGAVYVFLGLPAATSAAQADADLTGAPYDTAGLGMSRVGDTDGDGRDDMLVSAISEGGVDSHRGAVYLFRGPIPSGALTASDAVWTGVDDYDVFGEHVASGDANGDGFAELVVSSPGYNVDRMGSAGAVWYFGVVD